MRSYEDAAPRFTETTMTRYDFYGRFRLEIRGQATVTDYLRQTFEAFAVEDEGGEPDLVVSVAASSPDPDVVLGDAETYFGVDDGRFVIQEGRKHFFVVDPDWRHVRTSPENIHHHVAFLVEFEVRNRLAEEGRALAHAAGVEARGETLVLPAWRSAGKTNTMLALVADGADYLADDRVWVDSDGSVEEYPIPINVLARNDGMLGMAPDLGRIQRLRQGLSEAIQGRVEARRSILEKMAYFFTEQFVALDARYRLLSIEELIPSAGHASASTIDRLVFLRSEPGVDGDEVAVEPIGAEEARSSLRMISYWEWNRRLHDYFGAFDVLFPDGDRLSELEALLEAEARIFEDLAENVESYRAHLPRERDWIGTGIDDQVREALAPRRGASDASSVR